ncbi:hypothetical protein HJFPF1_07450 [Paramyrothecium foliicola]|nr:hypothetical protein HJFPF1_07450 [Paramyrothecium foliicola]
MPKAQAAVQRRQTVLFDVPATKSELSLSTRYNCIVVTIQGYRRRRAYFLAFSIKRSHLFLHSPWNRRLQADLEVISMSRVYIPTESNLFSHSILPVLGSGEGPVRSAVLAMSVMEWGLKDTGSLNDAAMIAGQYKLRALRQLHQTLECRERAEESLLACILLASAEISQGSDAAWLQHVRGALAILDASGDKINAALAGSVLRYCQLRYVLLRTTERQSSSHLLQKPESNGNERLDRLLLTRFASDKHSRELVDPQLGCSLEMLDLICQISMIECDSTETHPSLTLRDAYHTLGLSLERGILELAVVIAHDMDEYLAQSSECFRIAALIYLQLAVFRTPLNNQKINMLHKTLLNYLGKVISKQCQSRRSFPMWPLFVAGCTSLLDEQRKSVLQLFELLEGKWPVSNISTVSRVLWTIWQTRDLDASITSCRPDDWRQTIEKFGWKLSLS